MRRLLAEHDADILRRDGPADDLDPLVQWTVDHLRLEA